MRAVVDTNIWVSSALNPTGAPRGVRQACEDGRFTLVTSEPLVAELSEVLARPRIRRRGVTAKDAEALVGFVRARAAMVNVAGTLALCRDPKDDVLIETALLGHADALVSRDEDLTRAPELIRLLEGSGVRLLTVRRFLEELEPRE